MIGLLFFFKSLIPETSSFQNCKSLRKTSKLLQKSAARSLVTRRKQIPAKLVEFQYYNAE